MALFTLQRVLLTFFLINFFTFVASLYFHVAEGEQKCFTEEIPSDTRLVGDYSTQVYDELKNEYRPASEDVSVNVVVRAPDDRLVLSEQNGSRGRFSFTSFDSGKHRICLRPNSSQRPLSAGRSLVVHLDVRVGERTNNYTQIKTRDRLTQLQLTIRRLSSRVQQIQSELDYQRSREERFRDVTHNTHMWIFWWPIIRSLYVVAFIMFLTGSW